MEGSLFGDDPVDDGVRVGGLGRQGEFQSLGAFFPRDWLVRSENTDGIDVQVLLAEGAQEDFALRLLGADGIDRFSFAGVINSFVFMGSLPGGLAP
jgi:hypothetical protein